MTSQDLNDRVTRLEERYTNIEQRLDRLTDDMNRRFGEVGERFGDAHADMVRLQGQISHLSQRFDRLMLTFLITGMALVTALIGGFAAVTTAIITLAGRVAS